MIFKFWKKRKQQKANNLLKEAFICGSFDLPLFLEAIKLGANMNITLSKGRPILHEAVKQRLVNIVEILLEKGANKEIIDVYGKKAIDYVDDYYSFESKQAELITDLLKKYDIK